MEKDETRDIVRGCELQWRKDDSLIMGILLPILVFSFISSDNLVLPLARQTEPVNYVRIQVAGT